MGSISMGQPESAGKERQRKHCLEFIYSIWAHTGFRDMHIHNAHCARSSSGLCPIVHDKKPPHHFGIHVFGSHPFPHTLIRPFAFMLYFLLLLNFSDNNIRASTRVGRTISFLITAPNILCLSRAHALTQLHVLFLSFYYNFQTCPSAVPGTFTFILAFVRFIFYQLQRTHFSLSLPFIHPISRERCAHDGNEMEWF